MADVIRFSMAVAVALGAAFLVGLFVVGVGVGAAIARAWVRGLHEAEIMGAEAERELGYRVGAPCACGGWREAREDGP